MFIVFTKDGNRYREGIDFGIDKMGAPKKFSWNDIPEDVEITQVQLTYPFTVQLKKKGSFAPLLTIGKYDRYYFYNEATVRILITGSEPAKTGQTQLEAKIVGGIDDQFGLVIETRLDKLGNCNITRFPLKELEAKIQAGMFRSDIIRKGASI